MVIRTLNHILVCWSQEGMQDQTKIPIGHSGLDPRTLIKKYLIRNEICSSVVHRWIEKSQGLKDSTNSGYITIGGVRDQATF